MNIHCIKCFYYDKSNTEKFECYEESKKCPGYWLEKQLKEQEVQEAGCIEILGQIIADYFTSGVPTGRVCACTTECYSIDCSIFWEAYLRSPKHYDKNYLISIIKDKNNFVKR